MPHKRKAASGGAITFNNALEKSFLDKKALDASQLRLVRKIDLLDLKDVVEHTKKQNHWSSSDRAEQAARYELQYRQFLFLQGVARQITPISEEMDEIWHSHILFTQKYKLDCQKLYGKFLHHTPSTATTSEEVKKLRTAHTEVLMKKYFVTPKPAAPIKISTFYRCE